MAKYSEKFKIKLVTEYLQGNHSYGSLAKKYNMGGKNRIYEWVKIFEAQGRDGLKTRKTKKRYSVQFKLSTVQFIKETGASCLETAIRFNMNSPSLINSWVNSFKLEGIEGLKPKSKGRPSMSKKPNKQSKEKEQKLTREAELERENELLRLEIAYLKKLRAFRENPNVFLEKHKQHWHSNSKKKGSD
ncbi:transposase [Niallia sp. Krafla_26]|uniref:transposase n=1 Tax=Niallia sp. Krafla_26 TaxID=3064703 RepID=UPI003D17FAC3